MQKIPTVEEGMYLLDTKPMLAFRSEIIDDS